MAADVRKLKPPPIKPYDGEGDPESHLDQYAAYMCLRDAPDVSWCRAFLVTLTEIAQTWFQKLAPGSIGSFEELKARFLAQFISGRTYHKSVSVLFAQWQKEGESLGALIARFNSERLKIPRVSDESSCQALISCLLPDTPFANSLSTNPVDTYDEIMRRAEGFIRAEEVNAQKKAMRQRPSVPQPSPPPRQHQQQQRQQQDSHHKQKAHPASALQQKGQVYTAERGPQSSEKP